MTDTAALQTRQPTPVAQLDPQALIEKAIETGAGIDTMERLFALAKEIREVRAKEAWYAAMADFQRDCPPIKKTKTANIRANFSYRYAPLDEIVSVIAPVMGPLGLSISWHSRVEPDKVVVSCRISHTLGHHEESGEIAMPIVQGDSGATPPQRVGIAATYAKRYALLGIIGMAPEDDEDGAGAGSRPPEASGQAGTGQTAHGQDLESVITEPQIKRLMAIANGAKWTEEQIHDLVSGFGYNSRKEIRVKHYDAIVDRIKEGPGK
jgi:hypothetical protein